MVSVDITPEERTAGRLAADKLAAAVRAMDEDGVVALRGAIDLGPVDALGARMFEDLARYEAEYEIDNNFQGIRPPPFHPYLFPEIIFNEPAVSVSRAVLGEGAALTGYGANTAFVGAQTQHVHADSVPPEPGPYGPCAHLVVNVPLVDMTEANGATIYWPGTHRDLRLHSGNRFPTEEMLAEWEARRPSERVLARRGDLVLRDLRVWHGGMPNRTTQHRPMLAIVYSARRPDHGTFEAEEGSEAFWASHPLVSATPAFAPRPIEYLRQGHSRPKRAG